MRRGKASGRELELEIKRSERLRVKCWVENDSEDESE